MLSGVLVWGRAPFLARCFASDSVLSDQNTTTVWKGPSSQFVTCILQDQTGWWWGTDNDGLWHYSPSGKLGHRWAHVRAQDGLYDDSITCLSLDHQGRLWVGTERRGVSVYNGGWWKSYGALNGPLGVHINAVATNPRNGDVWVGSEAGLSIYSYAKKSWSYQTKSTGLTTDNISCIVFTNSGKAIIGTALNGLGLSSPGTDYKKWDWVTASDRASVTEAGPGIPSNQINCLLVNKAGEIFCGTSSGLASSTDEGGHWNYQHGQDWQQKIRSTTQHASDINLKDLKPPLREEFISALAYDNRGHLYVGHPALGYEVIDDHHGQRLYHSAFYTYGTFIKAIAITSGGGVLIGNYGDGISGVSLNGISSAAESAPPVTQRNAEMPNNAPPPGSSELASLASKIASFKRTQHSGSGYFLNEDWQTQGNWVGRYGRQYAMLCALNDGHDFSYSATPGYKVSVQLGNAANANSSPSHWMQWSETQDPRILFAPSVGVRREGEWNDLGDGVSAFDSGPDLWLNVQVPKGPHRISLYFVNKDGHTTHMRYRDYIVRLRSYEETSLDFAYMDITHFSVLAETRVRNFWPGVYESFVVNGPGKYYIQVDRNYSLNAIIQGVFIDRLNSDETNEKPYRMNGVEVDPAAIHFAGTNSGYRKKSIALSKTEKLWSELDNLYSVPASGSLQRDMRILLLRSAVSNGAPPLLLTNWRWQMGLWDNNDWPQYQIFLDRMKNAVKEKH